MTLTKTTAKRKIIEAIRKAYKPREIISVSQWADRYRELPSMSTAEHGRWRTDRFPFLREPMDNLSSESEVNEQVVMKGVQLGFTEAGLNWMGYVIHNSPGPMLLVMPTEDVLKKNSKMRIDPLLESPALRTKISKASSRSGDNSTFMKIFEGGILVMTGANAPAGFSSTPVKYVFTDEVDRYPTNVGNEGDPISLARSRTATFADSKIYIISTPTTDDKSIIAKEYENSDKRKYFVPCPHCGTSQSLEFSQMRWKPEDLSQPADLVWYECLHCNEKIVEPDKELMLPNGEWIATNPDWINTRRRGYHISSLYSPYGFYSWYQLIEDYRQALKNPEKMITFQNTKLAEVSKSESTEVAWKSVRDKAENYKSGTPPKGVIFLTAGVDVQRDRLEVEVVGWGHKRESWSIQYYTLYGDPVKNDVWNQLLQIKNHIFTREDGIGLRILKMCVDSGDQTTTVYNFIRSNPFSDEIVAIKGASGRIGRIFAPPTIVDTDANGMKIPAIRLYRLGVFELKEELYYSLTLSKNEDESFPDGFCHFPNDYDAHYFKSLTAEKYVMGKDKRGNLKGEWVKGDYVRNEVLDCRNYARAAAALMGYDGYDEYILQKLEEYQISGRVESANTPRHQPKPKKSSYWDRMLK